MAGQLVQVATNTVTSAVSSVSLVGIDSDDVYMLAFNQVIGSSGNNNLEMRFTESGTANTTSNYDFAHKKLDATGSFSNQSTTNNAEFQLNIQVGNDSAFFEENEGILYIYHANNSSEFTFITTETVFLNPFSAGLNGSQGGGVFTSASTVDGVNIFFSSGNIASGTFTLFRIV